MRYSVQLYSLRNEIQEYGIDAVLKEVKQAGFDCVEIASFDYLTPEEWVEKLDRYGLSAPSGHLGLSEIDKSLPCAKALKTEVLVLPWVEPAEFNDENKKKKLFDEIRAAKEKVESAGMTFAYHNHEHEYANGNDRVMEIMQYAEGMKSQLDIFWAVFAGQDPLELMDKYGEKLWCLHVKELDKRTTTRATEFPNAIVGEGKSKCKECIQKAVKAGHDLLVLEVEGWPCDWKECLKKSCDAMKAFAEEK